MANVPQAWAEYRDTMAAMSPEADPGAAPTLDEQAIDTALERSDALESSIIEHLNADDADVRDLAALQLQAAAAADLENAERLLAADQAADSPAADSPATDSPVPLSRDTWDELERILETPTERGIMAVVDLPAADEGQGAESPGAALKASVDAAIDSITEDSAKAAETTVKALAGIPGGDVARALQNKLEDNFKGLSEAVGWIKRKVVAFVLRAVRKLLAIFGSSTEKLRERLGKWVDDLDADKMKSVLGMLYGIDELKSKFQTRIDGDKELSEERAKAAGEELAALRARWHKRTWVIDNVGGLLAGVAKHIRNFAPPWGHIAYAAVFATATGYAVFGGGDYLDWNENDGVLDLVDGVGSVVDEAVGAGART